MHYKFERMNKMEKYTDVKILEELVPMRVAYYCYVGENPERNAFEVMDTWFKNSGLAIEKDGVRVFGFNNPSPTKDGQIEYGYEVMVTIPNDYIFEDSLIKTKTFNGGKYAICSVQDFDFDSIGENIAEAWAKLNAWIRNSTFTYGEHQWLEEHTGFTDDLHHFDGMDLYLPIKKK